jgi:small subunit ribosomal protein S3e
VLHRMQVKIMRPHDAEGKQGPRLPLPDVVTIHEPKEDASIPEKGFEKEDEF